MCFWCGEVHYCHSVSAVLLPMARLLTGSDKARAYMQIITLHNLRSCKSLPCELLN